MPNNTFSPFAEILTAIGQGRDIQFLDGGEWLDISTRAAWRHIATGAATARFMRAKPDTIRIGDVEVPAPLREAPKVGEDYFYFEVFFGSREWNGDASDMAVLKRGVAFRTSDERDAAMSAVLAVFAPKD